MIYIGFTIYLFSLILLFYFFEKKDVAKFYVVLFYVIAIVPFIVLKVSPSLYFYYSGFFHVISLIFLFYLLIKKSDNSNINVSKYLIHIVVASILLISYFFILAKFHGNDTLSYLKYTLYVIPPIAFSYVLIEFQKKRYGIKKEYIVGGLFLLLLFEASTGILQFYSITFSDWFRVAEVTKFTDQRTLLAENLQDKNLVIGTFVKVANFGNTISLLIIYLFGKWMFSENFKINKYRYFTLILAVTAVVLGGVRNSFISLFVGIGAIVTLKNYKRGIAFFVIVVALLLFYQQAIEPLVRGASSRQFGFENPLGRLSGILVLFYEGDLAFDNLITLKRSVSLIDNIGSNVLFGTGQYHSLGYYEGVRSTTDAYLLFLIAEFGLVGLTLMLAPFILLIRYLSKYFYTETQKRLAILLFVILLLQMIVDQGLFSPYGAYSFIMILATESINGKKRFTNEIS